MEERGRKRSTISHLVAPIVNIGRKLSPSSIGRKLSRREKSEDHELGTEISESLMEYTVPIDADLGISDEFISQMREVFKEFDKDNSGFICSREFGPLLRALGKNPTHAEVNSLMAMVDVDHNGKLDLGEFIMMMHNNSLDYNREKEQEQDIKEAFRAFDRKGDGRVAVSDVKIFLRSFSETFSQPEIDGLVAKFDETHDGYFDIEEFEKFLSFVQY